MKRRSAHSRVGPPGVCSEVSSSSTPPFITRVQPLKPRGLKVRVHLDRGEPFEVVLEALERHRLGVGDSLTRTRKHDLLNDHEDLCVRDAALNLISYRARTRAELRRRLLRKGFRPARIDLCLDRLEDRGLIDDEAVAAAFIRDRLRHRPRGRASLASELRAKGVSSEMAFETIRRVFDDEDTDDATLARQVAESWVARQSRPVLEALVMERRSPEREKAMRRLVGYLARRGFRGDAMSSGVRRALDIARSD